ncbi:ExbD/TolR family protein [Haloferula sp.]|uniref:ExbD/TolR family protein n=1 Tax=Haloferula sp. TaxID=2497595 RepID=UPI00329C945E
MRMRRRRAAFAEDGAEVPLSPLIDCVFLLLIFFLVTSILKRKEKQIQVDLPDGTASVAALVAEESIVIGIDAEGKPTVPADSRDKDGSYVWLPLDDLAGHLKTLVLEGGPGVLEQPMLINAHRDAPFQKAIDALDLCKLQGFSRVSVKTRQHLASEDERLQNH